MRRPSRSSTARRSDQQIDIILANMERWRWLPRDLGKRHVMVNMPDFTLRVMHDGAQVWTTRIVIGKPGMPTPLLTRDDEIHHRQSDLERAAVDRLQRISAGAGSRTRPCSTRMGLKVEHNRDGSVHISQPPGDGNALGRIRFNFPNKFLVYQHDTPDKYLFAHDERAYSHGCMRVQDPAKYAEVLLRHRAARARARPPSGSSGCSAPASSDIQFPTPIPVHLTYQTAFVDDAGKLQFRHDVYGLDSRTLPRSRASAAWSSRRRNAARARSASDQQRPGAAQRRACSRRPSRRRLVLRGLFGGGQLAAAPARAAASRHALKRISRMIRAPIRSVRRRIVNCLQEVLASRSLRPFFAIVARHAYGIGGDGDA